MYNVSVNKLEKIKDICYIYDIFIIIISEYILLK